MRNSSRIGLPSPKGPRQKFPPAWEACGNERRRLSNYLSTRFPEACRNYAISRYICRRVETVLAVNESTPLQLAIWTPRGNALIYVYQNNIYYRPQAEVPNDYQITDTGVFGTIYNGVPDWVYEGE